MENDRKLKFNALEYDFRLWIYSHNGGVLTLDRLEWPVQGKPKNIKTKQC